MLIIVFENLILIVKLLVLLKLNQLHKVLS